MAKRKEQNKLFGGIDPGKKGFLSLYDGRNIVEFVQMPLLPDNDFDIDTLNSVFKRWASLGVKFVIVEEQRPMPKEGAIGAFSAGRGFGHICMGLHANGVPYTIEASKTWKKEMHIPTPAKKQLPKNASKAAKNKAARDHKAAVKAESIKKAQAIFPGIDFRRTEQCKNLDDNKAESALLSVLACRRSG